MIRAILTQSAESGNALRDPCITVAAFDDKLRQLVADMWDTMYAANGVGLAAPQIGLSMRIAVIDTARRESTFRRLVLVNPKITSRSGWQTGNEGCLSMPGLHWLITRANRVAAEYQDLDGQPCLVAGRELLARCIQHELDHLDGVLCNALAATLEPLSAQHRS